MNDGVQIHEVPAPRLRNPPGQLLLCAAILRELRRLDPDIVHFQHGHLWFSGFLGQIRKPLVVTVHDAQHHPGDLRSRLTPQAVISRAWSRATELIAHSASVKNELVDQGFDADRIHVVPHPAIGAVDLAPGAAGRPARDPLLRPDLALQGARPPDQGGARHRRAGPGRARGRLPGAESFDRYTAMMSDPALFEVHNAHISNASREELFERAAVVVLPYVEASQSGVIPLAYSHWRPVVATRVGGLPEMVDEGETGFLVAPGDPQALADATVTLLADPARRDALGERGHHKLAHDWSSAAIGRMTASIYDQAVRRATEG